MNLYLHELKTSAKSLLVWAGIMALLILIGITKYAAYAGNPEMLAILETMPQELLAAFNMNAFNLTTLSGFFGVMFAYYALMGAVAAAMWGSEAISREERGKTAEFTLTLPLTRTRLVTVKALAALTNAALFVLFTWTVSLAAAHNYAPDAAFRNFLALEMGAMFLLELIFLAVGLLLACSGWPRGRTASAAVGLIVSAYALAAASSMFEALDFLKWVTPFRYFDAADLYRSGRFSAVSVLLAVAIVAVCLTAAYRLYNRRDVYI